MKRETITHTKLFEKLAEIGITISKGTLHNYEKVYYLYTSPERGSGNLGRWTHYSELALLEIAVAFYLMNKIPEKMQALIREKADLFAYDLIENQPTLTAEQIYFARIDCRELQTYKDVMRELLPTNFKDIERLDRQEYSTRPTWLKQSTKIAQEKYKRGCSQKEFDMLCHYHIAEAERAKSAWMIAAVVMKKLLF